MLHYRSAGRLTTRFLLGISLYTVVAEAVFLVLLAATGQGSLVVWLLAGAPWLLVVGLPYLNDYRALVRLTRGR